MKVRSGHAIPGKPANESEAPPWLKTGEAKRSDVLRMFSELAPKYDLLNRVFSFNLDRRWRRAAAKKLDLQPGQTVLDLCCGTGDFMSVLRSAVGREGQVFGFDFCLPMLELASQKDPGGRAVADACCIPMQGDAVDAVSVGWGIRNVPDIDQAHAEICRVLKSGGRFVSVDMAMPRNPIMRWISTHVGCRLIPRIGAWISSAEAYKYLPESTLRFMGREDLTKSMQRAGFTQTGWKDLFFGNICIHWGVKP